MENWRQHRLPSANYVLETGLWCQWCECGILTNDVEIDRPVMSSTPRHSKTTYSHPSRFRLQSKPLYKSVLFNTMDTYNGSSATLFHCTTLCHASHTSTSLLQQPRRQQERACRAAHIGTASLRNVFVSAVSEKVERGEVCVDGEQVQAEQHHQHLDDDPDQSRTGTQSKHLWTEPGTHTQGEHTHTHTVPPAEQLYKYWLTNPLCRQIKFEIKLSQKVENVPLLNAKGHSGKQNVCDERHC